MNTQSQDYRHQRRVPNSAASDPEQRLREEEFWERYRLVLQTAGVSEGVSVWYPGASREWAWQYVFPAGRMSVDPRSGKVRRHHVDETSLQQAVKAGLRAAGIAKLASCHSLRHSFATALVVEGSWLRVEGRGKGLRGFG